MATYVFIFMHARSFRYTTGIFNRLKARHRLQWFQLTKAATRSAALVSQSRQ